MIRCYHDGDAALTKEALDSSHKELRVWMAWAAEEPLPVEHKVELLRGFRERFLAGEDFIYGVFDREEKKQLGGTGLHPRVGPRAFEIGYWIRSDATGKGLATEAAAALTRVGFELCEVDRLEIRVEPTNAPSLAIPPKLGYPKEALLKRRIIGTDGEMKDLWVHSLFASEYPTSPAARFPYRVG